MSQLQFPVPVKNLANIIPHRPPMVWVDSVLEVTQTLGVCSLKIDADAHYMESTGQIRRSALLEFIAQSYGFASACQHLLGFLPNKPIPKITFLAQIKNAQFFASNMPVSTLRIETERLRELGPLTLARGSVKTGNGELLATADLKLFAE